MVVLHIEHTVSDYDAWKGMFDADPADRKGSGVSHYRVARGADDPHLVAIDLAFADVTAAEAMLDKLRPVWAGPAGAALSNVSARIMTVVEDADL